MRYPALQPVRYHLSLNAISKHFHTRQGKLHVLDSVDLAVQKGEFLCLLGPSGCGKSTLFNIIAGLENPDAGEVLVEGEPVSGPGPDRVVVFQDGALFPWLTALGNVAFGLSLKNLPPAERRERAMEALEMVRLTRFADSYIHELSGGMRQRVLLALGLVLEPKILILDEPTTALDILTQRTIIELLRRLKDEFQFTMIFISHDLSIAAELADRVATMYAGQIVELCDVYEAFSRPRHPYTLGLIRAVPTLHGGAEALSSIPGSPPDLVEMPPGCKFRPRCPFATERCLQEEPVLTTVAEGHQVSCHHWQTVLEESAARR